MRKPALLRVVLLGGCTQRELSPATQVELEKLAAEIARAEV